MFVYQFGGGARVLWCGEMRSSRPISASYARAVNGCPPIAARGSVAVDDCSYILQHVRISVSGFVCCVCANRTCGQMQPADLQPSSLVQIEPAAASEAALLNLISSVQHIALGASRPPCSSCATMYDMLVLCKCMNYSLPLLFTIQRELFAYSAFVKGKNMCLWLCWYASEMKSTSLCRRRRRRRNTRACVPLSPDADLPR